jgi:hypothetical protein
MVEDGRLAQPKSFNIIHEGAPSKLRLGGDFRHARTRSRRSSLGSAWMDFPAFFWASRSS